MKAYFNFKRKSTVGWSIGNILLDITGSVLSLLQQSLMAYNFNSIDIIFGNPVKFGLAILSMGFDCLFIIQHYVLYPQRKYNQSKTVPDENSVSLSENTDSSEQKTDISIE
ncbi:hypothetical protein ACOME3_006655 [Neoechinorhynchus agilis]